MLPSPTCVARSVRAQTVRLQRQQTRTRTAGDKGVRSSSGRPMRTAIPTMMQWRLRVMPYWEHGEWSALLGDETVFDQHCGNFVAERNRTQCLRLRPASAGWPDEFSPCEPWRIAELLMEKYPAVRRKDKFAQPQPPVSEHRQNYIDWLTSLVAQMAIHPNALPAVSVEPTVETVWLHHLTDDMKTPVKSVTTFLPPPPGMHNSTLAHADTAAYAVALPRDTEAPSLVWPTNRKSDSTLDLWYEDNARGEPKELG